MAQTLAKAPYVRLDSHKKYQETAKQYEAAWGRYGKVARQLRKLWKGKKNSQQILREERFR